jgi:trehalose 6-phosphate synthase
MAELVVASNRGPVQFEIDDDGNLSSGRGAGGMVTALGPALAGQGGTWVAAAISDGDRVAARRVARSGRLRTIELAQGPVRLRSLVFDPREYQGYYNRVANRTIWFLHHYLFDVPRHPRFDRGFRVAWQHYEGVNQAFAAACDDEADHWAMGARSSYRTTTWPWSRRCCASAGPTCASPTSATARGPTLATS